MEIAAIILASGFSRRMGENKLLMAYKGRPMIAHVMALVADMDFSKRLIVTSYEEIIHMAADYGIKALYNDSAWAGQSRSVVLGAENAGDCDGLMFFNGDMPCLKTDTVRLLIEEFEKYGEITVPMYDGKRGSPVIFPKRFKKALMALKGDAGGRGIIAENKASVRFVPIHDAIQGRDFDAPEDFKHVR